MAGLAGERRGPLSAAPRYRWVFWDWNGTLLDDLGYAIGVRNRIFPRFDLPAIQSVEAYHEQFSFPVRLYYERAGATDDNFVTIADAWMEEYVRGAETIPLHRDAAAALHAFGDAGLRQILLSASDRRVLSRQLAYYGIEHYFTAVLGLNHIYATGKQELGDAYMRENRIPPHESLLIGDTLHDAEVAGRMGVDCILVARGHQDEKTLRTAGVPVLGRLTEAVGRVLSFSP